MINLILGCMVLYVLLKLFTPVADSPTEKIERKHGSAPFDKLLDDADEAGTSYGCLYPVLITAAIFAIAIIL